MSLQPVGADSQPLRGRRKSPVPCPQVGIRVQQGSGQQVGIDVADAETGQPMVLDHDQYVDILCGLCLREVVQQTEDFPAVRQSAEREFADHPARIFIIR